LNKRPINEGESFSDVEFWPAFLNDLCQIKEELIIFSPFLTTLRIGKLHNYFIELISKGIKIFIIIKSPNQQPANMRSDSIQAINFLKSLGIIVKFRENMHEKIALIDREIKWVGSLNRSSDQNTLNYKD
jgi:phosphatidylserine/phosphatidylglycerophosphate/cardiolipin synthase-like enzyme